MAVPDPNTLLASVNCYSCSQEDTLLNGYKLGLLKAILLAVNPGAMTDPNTLLASVACYTCGTLAEMQMIELALLAQIAAASGSSSSGQIMVYTGANPTADGLVPTNQNNPAEAYKRDGTGPIYVWDTVAHAWG